MTTPCELLVRAGRGDREAFAALYDRTCGPAYRLALCLAGNPRDAEELLCRGYLEAWRRAPGFDPAQGSAAAWLLGHVLRLGREQGCDDGPAARVPAQRPAEAGSVLSTRSAREVVASTPR